MAGRLEELGAGDGDVAEPDQHDRDPPDRVVGDEHDEAGGTKNAPLMRAARSEVETELTRAPPAPEQHREHGVGAEQPGQEHVRASVATSQGMTTLRSTWLVPRTPSRIERDKKPRLRSALPRQRLLGRGRHDAVVLGIGSRVMKAAFAKRIAAVTHGTARTRVSLSKARARAADHRAEREADVQRPRMNARGTAPARRAEDVDRRHLARTTRVADQLDGDRHQQERREAADEGPQQVERGAHEGGGGPLPSRPTRSASLPSGTANAKVTAPAMVRPSPTWAALSPTIWVKKTALPVMKAPSPVANRTDCSDSRRASGSAAGTGPDGWAPGHPITHG